MSRQTNTQKQIATFPSARSRFPLAGQADALSFMNTTRDFHLIIFHFVRAGATQRNRSCRSMQRFLECDHDVRFDVTPAFRCRLTSSEAAKSRSTAASAEKCFEKIAEPGSAKFELHPVVASPLIKSAARLLSSPLRRRLKSPRLVPIRSQLIVFLSLCRIAQDFVRLVDLLELFFGGL